MPDGVRARPSEVGRTRLVADAAVVGAAGLVVIGLSGAPQVAGVLSHSGDGQVLVLAAAGAAAAGSILAGVAARLVDDPRSRWIAAALALYAVAVLPSSVFAAPGVAGDIAVHGTRLVAYLVMIGMLVAAVRPPSRVGVGATWAIAVVGGAFALAVPLVAPVLVVALLAGPVATVAVLAGWTAVAAAVAVEGYLRRSIPSLRLGLGLVVLAGAQLHSVLTATTEQSGDLVFSAARLFGLLVAVTGLAQLVRRTLARLRSEHFQQQDELCSAAVHVERAAELAAERDHELRNGLAGLAGITHLLSSRSEGPDHERLKHAVLAELGRLHTILDGGMLDDGDPDGPGPVEYDVEDVLLGLVTLRRSAGRPAELDVEPGLRARGRSTALAQVVTNLLANCQRHAPGTRISVRAYRRGPDVVVDVRDGGPGLPAGGATVLGRGVHDTRAGGAGLGLHISRQLVEREGGVLSLRTVDDPPGCLASVTVPAAAPSGSPAHR